MESNLPLKLQPTRDGKLWKNITCTVHVLKTAMAAASNAHSYKPTQFLQGLAIPDKQTNKSRRSDSIAACKLQKIEIL